MNHQWNLSCLVCRETNRNICAWKLNFNVPLNISDESGTWKNIPLNDQIAAHVMNMRVPVIIEME